jgi:hypothetical protein
MAGGWLETTNAREGFLRALFFDDVCMSQEGQSCQRGNMGQLYQGRFNDRETSAYDSIQPLFLI